MREDLRLPDSDIGKEIETRYEAGEDILVSFASLVTCTCSLSNLSLDNCPFD